MKIVTQATVGLFLVCVGFGLVAGCSYFSGDHPDNNVVIAKNGTAYAEIIIPVDASRSISKSAALLGEYIERSCGVKLDVLAENKASPDVAHIFIGDTEFFRNQKIDIGHLGDQGFLIEFPTQTSVIIVGQTDTAVEFGVYEFLERYLGVRWLFPGALGEYVPVARELTVKRAPVEQVPFFTSRHLSGVTDKFVKGASTWTRRNRMLSTVTFHHNLNRLLPPKEYAAEHPEYYPVINGKRLRPSRNTGWQPCFSNPEVVNVVAENIMAIFQKHPDFTSVSLGVNDLGGFCECEKCLALDTKGGALTKSLIGNKPLRSESYYNWCNQVVEKVVARYPDKRFGLLAYSDIIDPPQKCRVNSHIVPFICYDRMQWLDKTLEKEGKTQHKRWRDATEQLGWYDYVYGEKYIVPRLYLHHMAQVLRYGYENKVRCFYAEAYPGKDWHEGPKLYVFLKLLWNPYQDVGTLMQEWCEAAVGKRAAVSLMAYYKFCETFWTERIPQSKWFKENSYSTFLPFRSYGYLNSLEPEDIQTAESLLLQAVRDAETVHQKQRAELFLNAFLVYKQKIEEYNDRLAMNESADAYRTKQVLVVDDFNESLNGWGSWQRTYSKARLEHSADGGHNDAGALSFSHLEKSSKSPLCHLKLQRIDPGALYRYSAWVKKGNGFDGNIRLVVKWKDKKKAWYTKGQRSWSQTLGSEEPENEWHKLNLIFKAPQKEAAYAVLFVCVGGATKGVVLCDDVMLEEVAPPWKTRSNECRRERDGSTQYE